MKILFVVPYVPNLIRARSYNLIRQLASKGHQVTLATLWSNSQEIEAVEHLRSICSSVYAFQMPKWRSLVNTLVALPSRSPLQANFSWQPHLSQKIQSLLSDTNGAYNYDVLHVEHLRGVKYGISLQSRWKRSGRPGFHQPPIVWDSVDSISLLFRQSSTQSKRRSFRWLTRFELHRTERYEAWLPSLFPRTLITSPIDRDYFFSLLPAGQAKPAIAVIPNGVDLDYFKPDSSVLREQATLVVSGKMSYHANVSMVLYLVQEIMPEVWAHRPDTKLWIVGKDPSSEIQALTTNPNITVTGTVDDIRPYLWRATVSVAPLPYGAGSQFKVLEGMACATPVVATPQAVSALSIIKDRDAMVGANSKEFADKVISLLEDRELQKAVGRSGRRYVEENHDWGKVASKLEEVYYDAIQIN